MMERQHQKNDASSSCNIEASNGNNDLNAPIELQLFLHDYKSISMLQHLTSLWQLVI